MLKETNVKREATNVKTQMLKETKVTNHKETNVK